MSGKSSWSGVARNGAESVLLGLKRNGVDFLFANSGTDFPPIIEALATLPKNEFPEPVTVPHETAGIAMAHGYYLATGKPQATMVHVNVGLANTAMGVINAAADNIPALVLSGRTPITERGRPGSRVSQIQYGQEMYDQSSLVSNVTKFNYELRYPEQGEPLVSRAFAMAKSEPCGPVYLSLPREPLMEEIPETIREISSVQPPASKILPDVDLIKQAAQWISEARAPLIICQRGDPVGLLAEALSEFANQFAIPVIEPYSIRNVLSTDDPMMLGYEVKEDLAEADAVLVLDSAIPWMESQHRPDGTKRIIHMGPDPLFQRMPVRTYRADLAIVSDPVAGIRALQEFSKASENLVVRRDAIAKKRAERRIAIDNKVADGRGSPMSVEWMSRCISDAMDGDAQVFTELGVLHHCMDLKGPNRVLTHAHSGGLGWAMPAALGAQLADREKLCIASVGDGSYMFANPVACHQIAEALQLPTLTIIKNNATWNAVRRSVVGAYPDGNAVRANKIPLTSLEPVPDFTMIAKASRAHAERVEHGDDLPGALERAIHVIRTEKRQALLDVNILVVDDS